MVEGRDELDRRREQHAVAEDVARHVADAGDGEGRGLDVDIDFAEMALHRFPAAAGRDAHALVVVALRAARSEGVAEPMMLLQRDRVGGVREGRGALVGRDDEIGVVAVMAHRVRRRHDGLAVEIVGEFEQVADEDAVALGALGEPGGAIRGRRELLREEAALGADRHDHRVLDLLRLDEAEHLGAEILRPVGPAQAAAGDLAEAHMHALDARRIDEDLVERARQRQPVDPGAVELEGDGLARLSVRADLEEVCAQGGIDQVDEAAQDAVVVEAGDGVEGLLDLGMFLGHALLALAGWHARVELGREIGEEARRDVGMAGQRVGDIALGIGCAGLAQIAAEGPQQGGLTPAEAGDQHELVEPVGFRETTELRHQCRFDGRIEMLDIDLAVVGALQRHIMEPDPDRVAIALRHDVVGPLVDDAEAHVLQHRDAGRERDRRAAREDLEVGALGVVALAPVEIDGAAALRRELLEHLDIDECVGGREALAIGSAEGLGITFGQRAGGGAGLLLVEHVLETVTPGADDGADAGFQRRALDARGFALVAADDVVGARERPLGIGGIGGREAPAKDPRQEIADAQAHRGVVAVLRDEDEDRDEAVELVDAGERADARPLGELEDVERELLQRRDIDLEELVARIGVEHVHQRSAGIACRIEADILGDARDLEAQIRNRAGRAGIGVRGQQADDAQFAVEPAVRREQLDADIVEMDAPVDAALDVGLGDDERLGLGQEGAQLRRDRDQLAALAQDLDRGIAQDAEARALDRIGRDVTAREAIGADAEQGEVVTGDPFEELQRLVDLVLRQRRRIGAIGLDHLGDAAAHRGPVVDGERDIGIDVVEPGAQLLAGFRRIDARDVDMEQALAARALGGAASGFAGERGELALGVAGDGQDRVGDEARLMALLLQFGERRIEQERLVVVDDLEDGELVLALALAVFLVAEAQVDRVGLARLGELLEGGSGGAGEHLGRKGLEILGDGATKKQAGEFGGHRTLQSGGCGLDRCDCARSRVRHPFAHVPTPVVLPQR